MIDVWVKRSIVPDLFDAAGFALETAGYKIETVDDFRLMKIEKLESVYSVELMSFLNPGYNKKEYLGLLINYQHVRQANQFEKQVSRFIEGKK